jgi:hypothetical protein
MGRASKAPRQMSKKLIEANGRRSGHRTQWAAQFAVASELCKRGYEVSFTMGNSTPLADLMVVSPIEKQMFLVDVKGLHRKNSWPISRKPKRRDLFYILVHVPDNSPNEFFILNRGEIDIYINEELRRLGRPDDYPMTGVLWSQAAGHTDWKILPP